MTDTKGPYTLTELPQAEDFCCCRGMVDNCHWKCFGRALDLGHCREGDCDRACMKVKGRPPFNPLTREAHPLRKGSK